MSEDIEERRKVPQVALSTVKWAIGLAVSVIIVLGGALWSASSSAAGREGSIKVLEARANAHDNSVTHMLGSVSQVVSSVSSLRESIAAFQAEQRANMANIKEKMERMEERINRLGAPADQRRLR